MRILSLLFLLSVVWVLPSHSRSIVQRRAGMDIRMVHQRPYVKQNSEEGFSGELKFQYQNHTSKNEIDQFFSGYIARFKGGWQGNVAENWKWGFKLASGGWIEPSLWKHIQNSTIGKTRNQPLGGFGGTPIWLDSFHISYFVKDNMSFRLGKMSNPYYDKSRYNLIWDEDLSPTGLTAQYFKELTSRYTLSVQGSAFLMNPLNSWMEDGSSPVKTKEYGFQRYMLAGSAGFSIMYDDYDFISQVAFYRVNSKGMLMNLSHIRESRERLPNEVQDRTSDSLRHKNNFSIVDIVLQMKIKNFWQPFTASVQLLQNFSADSDDDFGVVAGGILGEFDRAHAWNVSYHFFKLGRDVTLSHFTDSDIGGMGTAFNGHHVTTSYFLNSSVQLGAKYILRKDDFSRTMDHLFFGSFTVRI